MKGIKFDAYSLGLGGLLGVGVGFGLGYLLRRKAFAAQLDAEVVKVKERYNDRLKSLLSDATDDGQVEVSVDVGEGMDRQRWTDVVARTLPAPVAIRPKAEGYGAGPSSRRKRGGPEDQTSGGDPVPEGAGEDVSDPLEGLEPEEENWPPSVEQVMTQAEVTRFMTSVPDRGIIYPITVEEAGEVDAGWQTACVKWYEDGNTLVDERGSPIPNIVGTVGPLGPDRFGEDPENPMLCYVKNHKLEIIFEIERDRRSYSDVVLGYGNPANVKSGDTAT